MKQFSPLLVGERLEMRGNLGLDGLNPFFEFENGFFDKIAG